MRTAILTSGILVASAIGIDISEDSLKVLAVTFLFCVALDIMREV